MQNPNKPIWFNEDTYQTIQQSNTGAEIIDLSEEIELILAKHNEK